MLREVFDHIYPLYHAISSTTVNQPLNTETPPTLTLNVIDIAIRACFMEGIYSIYCF
jgi:hypothetical protein